MKRYNKASIIMCAVLLMNLVCGVAFAEPANTVKSDVSLTVPADVFVADTGIDSLEIEPGVLMPEFSPTGFEYEVYLYENQLDEFKINYVQRDENAVSEINEYEYDDGKKIDYVIRIYGSGDRKTYYVVHVNVLDKNQLVVDDQVFTKSETIDLNSMPKGFTVEEVEVAGEFSKLAVNTDGEIILTMYESEDDIKWFLVDAESGEMSETKFYEIDGKKYVIPVTSNDLVYGEGAEGVGYYQLENNRLGEFVGKRQNLISEEILSIVVIVVSVVILAFVGLKVIKVNKSEKTTRKEIVGEKKYFKLHLSLDEEDHIEKIDRDQETN